MFSSIQSLCAILPCSCMLNCIEQEADTKNYEIMLNETKIYFLWLAGVIVF